MAKKFVLFLGLILVVSLVFIPKLTGHYFEVKYKALIAQANAQQDKIQIKVLEYKAGWFTSNVVLELIPTKESLQPTDVIFTSMPIMKVNQTVYHGPIIISPSGLHFGMAEVDGSADMDRGTFRTIADFSNNWKSYIHVPATKLNLGPVPVDWQGLSVTMFTHFSNNRVDKFDMNLNFGGFTAFPNPDTQIVMQPFTLITQTKAHPIGVWVGNNVITLPGVEVLSQNTALFKLGELAHSYTYDIDYTKHYNSKFTLDLKNAQTVIPPVNAFSPIKELLITFSIGDLEGEAVAQIAKKAGVFANPTKAEMTEYAKSVLTPLSALTLHSYASTKLGDLTAELKMFPKGVPINAEDAIDKANYDVNIRVSAPLLEEMVKLAIPSLRQHFQPAVALGPGPALPNAEDQILAQQPNAQEESKTSLALVPSDPEATPTMWIGQWEKEGLILKSGNEYTFTFKKDSEGMTMNGKPFGNAAN